jgi:hypothetical protein
LEDYCARDPRDIVVVQNALKKAWSSRFGALLVSGIQIGDAAVEG